MTLHLDERQLLALLREGFHSHRDEALAAGFDPIVAARARVPGNLNDRMNRRLPAWPRSGDLVALGEFVHQFAHLG